MPLTVGLDLGTTSVTAVALDAGSGAEAGLAHRPNPAPDTAAEGRFEWQAGELETVAEEPGPDGRRTYLQSAARLLGPDAARVAGCLLSAGFLGATLYWMAENALLPAGGLACFLCDWVGARLAGTLPVTDPTNAAGSGLLDLAARAWNHEAAAALGLPATLFPRIAEAGERLGQLTPEAAEATGLPAGLPVSIGLGDNQAGFVGAGAERDDTALVNVGTGAQVSCFSHQPLDAAPLETRPYPRGGYLLCHISLSGGRSYALLHRLFESVGRELFGVADPGSLYAAMHRLGAAAPAGAGGLRCQPCFAGTRWQPARRGLFTGVGEDNLTPGHLVRALLEGLAVELGGGLARIRLASERECSLLVGAGNGLRENPVLARSVQTELGLPLAFPAHREEAAYGAALVAAVGEGLQPDLHAAGRLLRHEPAVAEA
ncbi:MAG: hypothetical protein HYU66_22955 [Armatimonadetes bacterium]|nr:hypothetical protein [Armatimonadota bacterium]